MASAHPHNLLFSGSFWHKYMKKGVDLASSQSYFQQVPGRFLWFHPLHRLLRQSAEEEQTGWGSQLARLSRAGLAPEQSNTPELPVPVPTAPQKATLITMCSQAGGERLLPEPAKSLAASTELYRLTGVFSSFEQKQRA